VLRNEAHHSSRKKKDLTTKSTKATKEKHRPRLCNKPFFVLFVAFVVKKALTRGREIGSVGVPTSLFPGNSIQG
jgi:hypothetical protein